MKISQIKEYINYNKDTGEFFWKIKIGKMNPGMIAGNVCKHNGYRVIKIKEKKYKAHRIAWMITTGKYPKKSIDHINGLRDDNRICNLRECDNFQNMSNLRNCHYDNNEKMLGVNKRGNSFRAQITINRKTINLGTYKTPEMAHQAYLDAKRKMHEFCTI